MRRALVAAAVLAAAVLAAAMLAAALAACGGSVATVDDAGTDAGAGPDTAPGVQQCLRASDCGAGAYCVFGGTCGKGGALGTCKPRPQGCTDIFQPACGCDGQTYGNSCVANSAGVDTNPNTQACPSGPESFACGTIFCDARTTYCQRSPSDVGGQPESDACPALPATCVGTTSCACFPPSTPCVNVCTQIPTANGPFYGFQITCPGG